MKKFLCVSSVLFFFLTSSALAVKVKSLYQVELPVDSQSVEARAQAVKQGFLQVLIKVSGDPDIEKNAEIKEDLQKAGYYVQEFSYSTSSSTLSTYLIKINYNAVDINRLLKKAGISFWGENRPLILVWATMTNLPRPPEILGSEATDDMTSVMKQQSKQYGLPLIFPMLDVMDVNQIGPEDIAASKLTTLKEASKRYAPDALLIGNMQQKSDECQSQWQLILGEHQWNWTIADKSSENVIGLLLNQLSQTLAKHYIVKNEIARQFWIKLEVSNIVQPAELNKLLHYLKRISSVQQLQLTQVSGTVVEIAVLIRGTIESFQQNAAVDQRLVFKSQDITNNKLVYDWVIN